MTRCGTGQTEGKGYVHFGHKPARGEWGTRRFFSLKFNQITGNMNMNRYSRRRSVYVWICIIILFYYICIKEEEEDQINSTAGIWRDSQREAKEREGGPWGDRFSHVLPLLPISLFSHSLSIFLSPTDLGRCLSIVAIQDGGYDVRGGDRDKPHGGGDRQGQEQPARGALGGRPPSRQQSLPLPPPRQQQALFFS